jgi:beta-lactamase superfamily II metal-dependent hydrolase
MKKITLFLVVISVLFGIIVSGCNGKEDSNGGNGYVPPPPTPASFTLSNLIVDSPFSANSPDLPTEVYPGEMVFIMVYVSNASKTQVSDDVILMIDGVEEEAQPVIRSPYGGGNIFFHVSRQSIGTYDVTIGSLSGSFTVESPPPIINVLTVHFIDVGQGDSILIDSGDTEILIDGGGRNSGVVAYINDYVDGTLEVVIATHPHADHIGGLIEVFDNFVIEEYWHSGDTSTTVTYNDFKNAFQTEGCLIKVITRGDTLSVSDLDFEVLSPTSLSGSTNNQSIILYLDYGEVEFLFTGDAEEEAEASMITTGILSDIDILKVAHHGSTSSSSLEFLNILQPEVAIYMAKEGNSYGHPHSETIVSLTNIGANIYGTDVHGTIVITTDGTGYEIQLEKQALPITTAG